MASSRLIIRNLPPSVDDARLRQHFSSAGPWKLTDARVQRSTGGASRGFGFLGFESPQEAQKALKHFGGTFLDSNRVSVAYADPIKPRGSKGKDSDRDGGAQVGAHTKHGAALETKRNAEKEDFIAASKKRSEARFWANDEGEMQVESGGAVAAAQAGDKDLEWLHKKAQGKAALEESQDQSRMEATSAGANLEGKGNAADRLFIRNLPFTATEEDIRATFESHGNVTEVHVPRTEGGDGKGFAFISFEQPSSAEKALTALDGATFHGRLLHVIPAQAAKQGSAEGSFSSSRKGRGVGGKIRSRSEMGGESAWHSAHVRSDAAVDAVSQRLGVAKSDLLGLDGSGGGDAAVRMAVAETQVIEENRRYFEDEGVDLAILSSTAEKTRSDRVILAKNLHPSVSADELMQLFGVHGEVVRILLPPSRTVALIEFAESTEAGKAFRRLSFRRMQHVPLYLEWAPQGALVRESKVDTAEAQAHGAKAKAENSANDGMTDGGQEDEDDAEKEVEDAGSTALYVKNLSFSTSEEMLKRRCEDIFPGSVRAVKIPRHSSGGRSGLSSGYGFVELASVAIAKRALKALQGVLVDGRALEVKPTEKRLTSAKKLADGQKEKLTNGKLMVRNVPFQAAPKEIRDLFATYGQVKTVRMPRKASGSGLRKHRGFAFVEMATAGEAERAMAALVDTHLYGRHLVLESAKEEDGVEELREKAKRDTRDRSSGRNKRLRGEL